MQCFQALAGDLEYAFTARTAIAHGLEIILEAGEHFGQTLHLVAAGNAFAVDKFNARIGIHRIDVRGDRRIFKYGQRAGDLFKQGRDDRKLLMVPVAFDESDVGLPDLHEIDDGLADQRIQKLMRLRRGQEITGHARLASGGVAAMVVQHELDRKQRFRNSHQFAVIELAAAIDIGLNGLSVAADVFTGLFGVDQPKCVFDAGKHADQLGHIRRIGVVLANAQIERVLDAQNVFFDDCSDAFKQRIVPSKQAAFRMRDFFFIRHDLGQLENLVNLFQRRRCSGIARNEVKQFLGQTNG